MDKIEVSFEYWVAPGHTEKDYELLKRCFRDGYIAGYKDDHKSRDEEIAELHESCNNYKKMYVDKMEEIKKLNKLREEINTVMKCGFYPDGEKLDEASKIFLNYILEKALKESE